MSKSKFKVEGRFNGKKEASVIIDRNTGVFTVRPKGFHKTYDLPLSVVADMVIGAIILSEAKDKLDGK